MGITSRQSWSTKDHEVASELVDLLGVSASDRALLGSLCEAAEAAAPAMSEEFYARVLSSEATKEFVDGHSIEGLHTTLRQWFVDLFSGVYDAGYAHKRIRIGQTHVRLGLPVRYPLAMLDIVMRHGVAVAETVGPEGVAAFRKVVSLDIAVFNQAYEDNQLHHLVEVTGNERLARLLLTSGM
jgi:hypothetical protein